MTPLELVGWSLAVAASGFVLALGALLVVAIWRDMRDALDS